MNMRITSIKLELARDEQESKLGEVDECIFASCFTLLFCIVDVGSWYFTALARTFYVCFSPGSGQMMDPMDTIFGTVVLWRK